MKLSTFTLQVLENFTSINQGIVILKDNVANGGTEIRSMSPDEAMQAYVIIPEKFNHDVVISDLKQVLNVIKQSNDSSLDFGENQVSIISDNSTTQITYANEHEVKSEYKKTLKVRGDAFHFTLSQENLIKILKLSDILQLPNIKLHLEKGQVVATSVDRTNPDAKSNHVIVGEANDTELAAKILPLMFERSMFKLIPNTYEVEVCNGLARLKAENLEYFITSLV
jgi:hypothetical protein